MHFILCLRLSVNKLIRLQTPSDYLALAMTDTHIGLAVIFDVPEGQDTATHKANFYAKSRKGTKELLYYGFASLGNKVLSIIRK